VSVRLFGQLKISLLDLDFLGGCGWCCGRCGWCCVCCGC